MLHASPQSGLQFHRTPRNKTAASQGGPGACLERLEDRRLLSVAVATHPSAVRSAAPIFATADPGSDAAPAIVAVPDASVSATAPFRYAVVATGTPAPTFSLSAAPSGMTIDSATGLISWTPGVNQVGVQPVKVRATNSEGSALASFKITVTPLVAPVIAAPPALSATAGGSFSYQVLTTGSPATSFSLGAAPAGMTIDSTGLISWAVVPATLGAQGVTVTATNSAGAATATFAVTVVKDRVAPTAPLLAGGPVTATTSIPLSWSGSTDNVGVVGYRIYGYTPAVYRGHSGRGGGYTLVSPAKYTLLVGGITATSYTLTGLAPNSTHQYAVTAYDAAGNESGYSGVVAATTLLAPSFSWTTNGSTLNPALTDVADHAINFLLYAAGSPAPTLTLVSAPPGVVFTPGQVTNSQLTYVTPHITWTPTPDEVGVYAITMRASNSVGVYTYSIPVTVTADTPQISVSLNGGITYGSGQFAAGPSHYAVTANPGFGGAVHPQYGLVGTPFDFQVSSASNAGPTAFAIVSGPAGLTIDPATGAATWTPTADQAGNTSIVISAVNSAGASTLTLALPTYFTSAPGVPAAHYYTSISSVGTNNPTMTWAPPAPSQGAASIADYVLTVTDAHTGVATTFDTHSAATSFALSGLGAGQYFVAVTALDAAGHSGIAGPAVSIYAAALPPVSWTISTPAATVGVPLSVQFAPANSGYLYSIVSGPAGATLDPHTGLLLWTPTQTGDALFTVAATSTNGWGTVDALLDIKV